jgi:ABC-type transport system involved in cytochrome c biogenesis permease subunit
MVFRDAPEGFDPQQIKGVCTQIHAMAVAAADLVRQVRQARFALYDNGRSLRLVPALDSDALESNRQPEDDLPTWISLNAVLYGSSKLLAGYPSEAVETVRKAWQEAATEYQDRDGADRAQRVTGSLDRFATAVRTLGEGVEAARQKLPIRHRDEKLIADTAYPPPEYTRTEVFYNQLDPFFWSWLLSCLAMVSLSLSLGLFRKPLFWLGLLLLVAAQAMNAYGLGLRVAITGWAPVTNMFETVIFVALVVAVLGLWFTLQPLVGLGLGAAWRMNAVPHTPEAVPLSDAQQSLLEPATWNAAGWVMLLPRLLLAGAVVAVLALSPYGYSADHTIVRLLPRVDVGGSLPTSGNVTVWLVGMCMLLLAVWLLPRMALATLTGILTVPYSWAKQGLGKPMAQVLDRKPFLFAGAAVAFLAAVVAYYAPVLDKGINPLMPVLRSNLWLTMHVLTITASYGAGALAWGLAVIALSHYLFGRYRNDERTGSRLSPAMCDTLGDYIYKVTQVAVLLLSAGTILGGLWADVSWGRFWGWDSKEVWALISVLLYLAVLHGRYAGMFGNFGLAVGSVFGATSILMAWYGVNFVLGSGLHTYGEGAGGLSWAVVIVVANWVYVALAAFRYHAETAIPMSPPSRQPPHP